MATATATRREPKTLSADPTERQFDEDGYEVRYEYVEGELQPFSLKPYPEAERPLYWNPIYPGQEMRWKARHLTEEGLQPTIQRERWTDGKYYPRNAWEEHMTRESMKKLPGGGNPDKWRGVNHPNGPDAFWRCQCTWPCGNFQAFEDHRRYLKHQMAMDYD